MDALTQDTTAPIVTGGALAATGILLVWGVGCEEARRAVCCAWRGEDVDGEGLVGVDRSMKKVLEGFVDEGRNSGRLASAMNPGAVQTNPSAEVDAVE